MSGKKSNNIQLPKEIVKAERARANKLTIIAVLATNLLLFSVMKHENKHIEVMPKKARKDYSEITLEVESFIPNTAKSNHPVSLMGKHQVVVHDCYLKNCNQSKCTLEVPSSKIKKVMMLTTTSLRLVPRIFKTSKSNKRTSNEFTI